MEDLKMKRKRVKKLDPPVRQFEPRIFEQFSRHCFMEGEGDEIKSRQPSK
jgi:hypothetical protein